LLLLGTSSQENTDGVKVGGRGFRSSEAAEVAGKTAPAEFLEGLSIEESSGA
jgi:hypothetical protein